MRAVATSLGLILLFNTASVLAQPVAPEIAAEEEAVRRQEALRLLEMKLGEAQALQKQGRVEEASRTYGEAFDLFPRIGVAGPNVEIMKKAVVDGVVGTHLQLAEQARRRGELAAAQTHIKIALNADPQNASALAMKLQNDKAIAASQGAVPSNETVQRVPEINTEKVNASTLTQDGKMLFEMGHIDEAEAKLKQAIKTDPENRAAQYYLNLIRDQRFERELQKKEIVTKDAIVEVEKAWSPSVKRDQLQVPNPHARTNLVYTSPQRQEIVAKLNNIRLNEVGYDRLPLPEVLKQLTDESIKRDPDQIGLNFMLNPHSEAPGVPSAPNDPNAPPVVIEQTSSSVDVSTIVVNLTPPLRNLRLADVLDAITTSADQPIRYEIRDYAVVFSPRTPEPTPLYTRTWKIDPNTFLQGLESVSTLGLGDTIGSGQGGGGGGGGGGQQNEASFNLPRVLLGQVIGRGGGGGGGGGNREGSGLNYVTKTNITLRVNDMVRDYFTSTGVNLDPQLGKSVFFNDRSGILFVRATLQDLEIIETAVQALNTAPPQVTIESKFAEISQEDSKALGFDWFWGNTLAAGGKIGMQGGPAPSFAGRPSAANPSGIFPGPGFGPGFPGPGTIFPSETDGSVTKSLRNSFGANNASIPELGTITGILTDPQFRIVIRALEQRGGADVLSAPKVTTISGRQAQISVLDLRTIVTGVDIQNNTQTTAAGGANNTVIQNSQPEFTIFTAPIPFGPVLDVIPYVSADGFSIQMTIIPTLTEFLGYEDPGDFAPTAFTTQGIAATATLPLPRLRIRQVTTSCNVYDGQTIVLGGLISENLRKIKDKVPMLGDLPFLGRLFRSESSTSDKRNLVIFVTPTIIDPAGNRMHSDEELPFARSTIPAQPAVSTAAQ